MMMKAKKSGTTITKIPASQQNLSPGSLSLPLRPQDLKFSVGDTVVVTGINQRGTVKFIGNTFFADGLWVGIELHTAFGKNDGSVQGQRYFECAPQHGVFVRPSYCTKEAAAPPGTHQPLLPPPTSSPASAASSPSASSWRGTWIAAESKSAAVAAAATAVVTMTTNPLPAPPGVGRRPSVDGTTSDAPSPMPLPTPRKVTVERMSPSLRTHSNSFNSLVEEPSDQLLDRLIESKAFAAKVQQYVHHAVDAAVERSLRSFAGDVQRRFEAVESLVEAIGAAVAEVCDDADESAPHAAPAPIPHGSNNSGSLHAHGRSRRSAGETEAKGPSPRGSPKQQELVELLDDSVTLADTPRRKANGVMDPYAEVARLRDTLEHVSHLAREAQEELSIEREEMEETIADLRAQLFHARDGASGSAVGGPATQRSE